MADRPARSEQDNHPVPSPVTGAPRWVKVFGLAALALLLLMVLAQLVGGGKHGPGRHLGLPAADGTAAMVAAAAGHADEDGR